MGGRVFEHADAEDSLKHTKGKKARLDSGGGIPNQLKKRKGDVADRT